jgi:hypothetical protein
MTMFHTRSGDCTRSSVWAHTQASCSRSRPGVIVRESEFKLHPKGILQRWHSGWGFSRIGRDSYARMQVT